MPRFFVEGAGSFVNGEITLTGEDAAHIARSLRMKPGEHVTVCDCRGTDYNCEITRVDPKIVTLALIDRQRTLAEPSVGVTLYQGLPKGDKMDFIVQKSVELGVARVVPVITKRSVSRPDALALAKKTERWNRIAAEAAKQSGRGIMPRVASAEGFETAVGLLAAHSLTLMLYENEGGFLNVHLKGLDAGALVNGVGVMAGPEGGFDDAEAAFARSKGVKTVGMGPRILRTETAPISALSAVMFATGNL